jgi:hypothetical protein
MILSTNNMGVPRGIPSFSETSISEKEAPRWLVGFCKRNFEILFQDFAKEAWSKDLFY